MIPMTQGTPMWNLGQFGEKKFKLSIKACGEDEVWNGVAREQSN